MTSATVSRAIGDAIVAKVVADLSPIPVGDGRAPDVATGVAYVVLDHMDGLVSGDLDDADTWVKVVVQVRCVADTRTAAQLVQDKVRASLLDRSLTVAEVTLMLTDHEVGGRVAVDNDAVPTPRMVAFDRIAFYFDTRS